MSSKEEIVQELERLGNVELKQVAEYIAFLKFRARQKQRSSILDESQLGSLYAKFADEDRKLAEEGMANYVTGLAKEDKQ